MSQEVTLLAAFAAGFLSFISPCVLPLIPGYISFISGLTLEEMQGNAAGGTARGPVLIASSAFVLGFTVIFVILGATTGGLASWLFTWQDEITVVMGALLILLGLVFAGFVPLLQREWRIHRLPAVGLAAAPLIGAIFALGWTPCIGPTYGVIVTLTINEGTAGRGALLSVCYALGLGIPFVIAALAYRRTLGALAWVRRHQAAVMRVGGLMLVAVGVLLVTGLWDEIVQWLQVQLVSDFEVPV